MHLNYTHTRLLVDNFAECYRFYRDVLGFTPTYGEEDGGYADFETGSSTAIALFSRKAMFEAITENYPAPIPAISGAAVLIFGVEDVDAAAETLRERGVRLLNAPHDRPGWGIRVLHLLDPAGNLIEINAPIPFEEG